MLTIPSQKWHPLPGLDGVPFISPVYSYLKCKHSIATSAGFSLFYFGRKANQLVPGNYLSGIVKAVIICGRSYTH